MDTLGVGFLLTAGLCMEHLLCPRDHGLCVHHVTSYAQYPVTPGEDTETRGEGVLHPKGMVGGDGTCCQSLAPAAPPGHFGGQGHFHVSRGIAPKGWTPEGLGTTLIPASTPLNLAGAWECVCFACGWKILIRSPALQQEVMASVRADGV